MPVIKLANEAHIYERITCNHRLTGYQVKIRRVGYPPYTKTFDDLKEARIAPHAVARLHLRRQTWGQSLHGSTKSSSTLMRRGASCCLKAVSSSARIVGILTAMP